MQPSFQFHQQVGVGAGGDDLVDPLQIRLEAFDLYGWVAQATRLHRYHRTVGVAHQPVAIGKHPDFDAGLIGIQGQRGQSGLRGQVMDGKKAAIGMNQCAAIERRCGQVDAQGLDLLQHGPRRSPGGEAEQHTSLTQ
ncbi:hypothetical protein D3C78_1446940 [compost metagenome]